MSSNSSKEFDGMFDPIRVPLDVIRSRFPDDLRSFSSGTSMARTAHFHIEALCDEVERLWSLLEGMEARKDAAYLERNQVVAALSKCFPSGIARTAIEGWSEDWHGCVYIDLPTGQASWHYHDSQAYLFKDLPPYTKQWDGHTTDEKYKRLAGLSKHDEKTSNSSKLPESWFRHSMDCRQGFNSQNCKACNSAN